MYQPKYIRVTDPWSTYNGVVGQVIGEDPERVLAKFGDPNYLFFPKRAVRFLSEQPGGIIQIIPFAAFPPNIPTALIRQIVNRLARIGLVLDPVEDDKVMRLRLIPATI